MARPHSNVLRYVIWDLICFGIGLALCIYAGVTDANISESLQQRPITGQGQIIYCQTESVYYPSYPYGGYWVDECLPTVEFHTASGQVIDVAASYS